VAWCEGRMARHMVPRYVEFLSELPLTPTEKVEKYRLREAGFTPATPGTSHLRKQAGQSVLRP